MTGNPSDPRQRVCVMQDTMEFRPDDRVRTRLVAGRPASDSIKHYIIESINPIKKSATCLKAGWLNRETSGNLRVTVLLRHLEHDT
jgi:hypothetical protein